MSNYRKPSFARWACLAAMLFVGGAACGGDKKGGAASDAPKVSKLELAEACANLQGILAKSNAKRGEREGAACVEKTRDQVSADKLAGYVGCLKAAKAEADLIACMKQR